MAVIFGLPNKLCPTQLPTESDVVSHSYFLKNAKVNSGEWKQYTSVTEVARVVAEDVCELWAKTGIPWHGIANPRMVCRKVERLLNKAKDVLKVPVSRRDEATLAEGWGRLFDLSLCPHREVKQCGCPHCSAPHQELCDCGEDSKVPRDWVGFIWDQRGPRLMVFPVLDPVAVQESAAKKMRKDEREEKMERAREQWEVEREQFGAAAPDSDLVDSQGERLSQSLQIDSDETSDSDWECESKPEGEGSVSDVTSYNTIPLPRLSRECDRHTTSNRAGAQIANAALKDYGVVTKDTLNLLICPSKLARERSKWGAEAAKTHEAKGPLGKLYCTE
jgi:hypothetical protein